MTSVADIIEQMKAKFNADAAAGIDRRLPGLTGICAFVRGSCGPR